MLRISACRLNGVEGKRSRRGWSPQCLRLNSSWLPCVCSCLFLSSTSSSPPCSLLPSPPVSFPQPRASSRTDFPCFITAALLSSTAHRVSNQPRTSSGPSQQWFRPRLSSTAAMTCPLWVLVCGRSTTRLAPTQFTTLSRPATVSWTAHAVRLP